MANEAMTRQAQLHQEELQCNLERSQTLRQFYEPQIAFEQEQQNPIPYFLRSIPYLTGNPQAAPGQAQPRTVTRSEEKKRAAMEKQYQKAQTAEMAAVEKETSEQMESTRSLRQRMHTFPAISKQEVKQEQAVLDKWLAAINEQEKADLMAVELSALQTGEETAAKEAEIRWMAQKDRTDAYRRMAAQMPLESKERRKAMERVESETVKTGLLRRKFKVASMPAGPEKDREAATIKRHARYDKLKSIFRKPTPYSREDAKVTLADGKQLINTGRATLGGTKAMYTFEDAANGEQWLFKEATTCVGVAKPEGAIVTEAASKLQQVLRQELSIPAYCLRDEKGKVVGSVQRRVEKTGDGVDLFKWQANPSAETISPTTLDDLMKEHLLDWLLCNFDTKGENFINQAGDHIISFDKEASFNHLLDKESEHMSFTYKPHSNDTIYNTIFRAFAEGKINLNLDANLELIEAVEQMDTNVFTEMFADTLRVKFKSSADYTKAMNLLRQRKIGLRDEYRSFYTKLLFQRRENTNDENERQAINERLAIGTFHFSRERQPGN